MSFRLTERIIKIKCGQAAYHKGLAYYEAGKVTLLPSEDESPIYDSTVDGNERYQISVEIDQHGDIHAGCTCAEYYASNLYCQHIAAVLIKLQSMEQADAPIGLAPSLLHPYEQQVKTSSRYPSKLTAVHATAIPSAVRDAQLTKNVLDLFSHSPRIASQVHHRFDTRTVLQVEFICKPVRYGVRKTLLGVELRLGPGRLYIVQQLREFLERLSRKEAFEFSKHFTYNPEQHSFTPEDDAILQQLIQIYHYEKMVQETASPKTLLTSSISGKRMLLIPGFAWESLLPLWTAASHVKLVVNEVTYSGIHVTDEGLPLRFSFDEGDRDKEGYQMSVQGLDELIVLDAYHMVLWEGKLAALPEEHSKRIAGLQDMLEAYHQNQLTIAPAHIESFMEQVVPGLMKLGQVQISQQISARMVKTSLQARLYLDRIKDRLLASLEFQYGNITINPLEARLPSQLHDQILIRDGEQEQAILALMEQVNFAKTESGYFLEDEESEYDFLYHIVPQLEKWLKVYATTAVKIRLLKLNTPPKVTVNVDERTEWLEFKFDIDGIPESHIRKLLKALEEKRRYYRLPNGALLPLETDEFQELISFMNETGIRQLDQSSGMLRVPAVRWLHLIDQDLQSRTIKLGKQLRKLLENMRNPDNLDFPIPESLQPVLRDYQQYGYQWLKTLAHYHFGGILADDMGLGKTVQSIAFLLSVLPEIRKGDEPALIVAPASLVYNWMYELQKFAPEIRTAIADGPQSERNRLLQDGSKYDVIITSYPLLRRDIEWYAKQSFHTLILDEAQMFKNHTTQTAQAVKEIRAVYRFALTGTPIENHLEELWSIYDAVFPELFQSKKAFHDLTREQVARRIRPFLLRRLKRDVLKELPEKIEAIQTSELLDEQKKLYVAYLAKLREETLKHLDHDTLNKNKIKILAGLTRLRQICCHPALFIEDYKGSSAKFEQLLDVIEECRSAGKRMLIFSQFTQMLGIISQELAVQGVAHYYLDGSTPKAERVELCNRFNEGERDVFLISLKAGGTGLNLTGADTVILYDLWWNPAVEQQAADRAYRIGQKKVVHVIRMITRGTIEDKMTELQERKKHMIDEVIQPGEQALSSLTEEDIREILEI